VTLEQAKAILANANLKTMTATCIARYKQALAMVADSALKPPTQG
jgi:hypothetical protein